MTPYQKQTVRLTSGAACEAVGRVIRDMWWDGHCSADITYQILKKLGFKLDKVQDYKRLGNKRRRSLSLPGNK